MEEKKCLCDCNHNADELENDECEGELSLKMILVAGIIFLVAVVLNHWTEIALLRFGITFKNAGIIKKIVVAVLFFVSYVICGLPVLKIAVRNLFKGNVFNEQFLMGIASIAAIALGDFAEAVAIMLFYQLGEYFQDYAVDKSKDSIKELMQIRPDKACVIRDNTEIETTPDGVQVGEIILVKVGERIPLDGIVIEGKSFVDTSALTGESVPCEVFESVEVMAGFVNTQGALKIKVTKPFGESSVSRILTLVQSANSKKAKAEKFITRFAKIYTPIVCFASLLVAIVPPIFFGMSWSVWIERAAMFLIVSCPCALVISVPLSFFGGIGAASRNGILIKGSNYLELLSRARIAVFDKTGTLTKGVFVVNAIHPSSKMNLSQDELVALATHAEKFSNHPISKSLKAIHSCPLCDSILIKDAEEIAGLGICVKVGQNTILAGNMKLMETRGVKEIVLCSQNHSGTVVHIAVDGIYAGHIEISDQVKNDSVKAVSALKKLGIKKTVMLTGDSKDNAKVTAATLNIDEVRAELLPEGKVYAVEELLQDGPVLFVGDGINDAPVLARADVGIAMGALGSDAAIEAADVVVMNDEPSKICEGIKIARRTMGIVKQNIIFALCVKLLIMVFAAFGIANMWTAVFGDVGVTFIAVLNSLRTLKKQNVKQ